MIRMMTKDLTVSQSIALANTYHMVGAQDHYQAQRTDYNHQVQFGVKIQQLCYSRMCLVFTPL